MSELPDFLTNESEYNILSRMLDRVADDIDKSEGSYIYDALAGVSNEIAQMKADMGEYLNRGFAGTTFGEYLDARCDEHGISRKPAVKSAGQVRFTGVAGTVIPAGTTVSTAADLVTNTGAVEFVTKQAAVIPAEGYVFADIEAAEAGKTGNVAAGAVGLLATPVNGVSAVTNESPVTGGADTESDDDLRDRFLTRVRTPGTSGNKADYMQWALEVAGVGAVQVIPLWNGPGTVKVVLLDRDKQPASQAIVDAAQGYIDPNPGMGEGKAPIGAAVTVTAAAMVNIDVTAVVVLSGTRTPAEVRSLFEAALQDYLESLAFSGDPTVRYVRIGSLLLDTEGVQDYSDLQVNGGTGNVAVMSGQVAVMGAVTLN
ncbi:phage-like element PBSX protein xkdT [Desulfocucumis palustris]|uniref:Phage-like element PBSX protein xkdT n=1 Tax=Desulfocucumis palustris TaxID=1898651 RepID=A0A2L2XGJ8_9FIRM|nr:baseplate J/gp47 family protein [Desulfocucumis palustris]GBF35487.1 phage-like element PBSX protein xkdT [Desulfocucumis palustris]